MKVRLIQGHALQILQALLSESVHLVVTSPPYWGLRNYGLEPQVWGDGWRGSYGLEPTIELYIEHTVQIFREVRRVLRKDGVLFLNLGDSYHGGGGAHKDHHANPGLSKSAARNGVPGCIGKAVAYNDGPNRQLHPGLKPKDLCGIPWRVALALQADGAADFKAAQIIDGIMSRLAGGYQENEQPMPAFVRRELELLQREYVQAKEGSWWLRSDIIWAKPNPMPESCTDRPTKMHEYIFLLTKSAHYFWDQEAVRENSIGQNHHDLTGPGYCAPGQPPNSGNRKTKMPDGWATHAGGHGSFHKDGREAGAPNIIRSNRNLRSVWTIATAPFPQAHFATFPPAIPERCIKAGTSERGCCPKCAAPWKRVVEKIFIPQADVSREKGIKGAGNQKPMDASSGWDGTSRGSTQTTTTGWTPTCICSNEKPLLVDSTISGAELFDKMEERFLAKKPLDPIPCTILDPFSGAGTSALVAAKLGRDSIGIELNPEYVEMSRKRIAGELGMLVEITLDNPEACDRY